MDTTANSQKVVFAPIRDFGRRFTDAGYQSYRYLVVARSVSTRLSGLVVEVLLKDSHQPSKAMERALLARLYNHHHSAAETLPDNFTGHAFFYSADYRYLTGTGYAKGKALAGTMRLTRAVPVTAAPAKKQSTANKTTGCTTYLIKGGTADAYYEVICGIEPDFGNLDPGQPGFFDPDYGGGPANSPITGGSTGGGSAGTAVEYIDPAATFTQGPTPPDVTQYNCGQLRNTHSDDKLQLGVPNTVSGFAAPNAGLTRALIVGQRGFDNNVPMVTLPLGPTVRCIQDPLNPSVTIDLRHMLVVAYHGPLFGNSVEIMQGLGGLASAYDHQDYFSNQLGYDFYNQYGNQISANPTAFAAFVQQFLMDRAGRSRNTDPDLIKQRCP